jgi:hypothetical protein
LHLELQLVRFVNHANELHLELQLAHKCSVNRANKLYLELQLVRFLNRANELHLGLQLVRSLLTSCTLSCNWCAP